MDPWVYAVRFASRSAKDDDRDGVANPRHMSSRLAKIAVLESYAAASRLAFPPAAVVSTQTARSCA